MTRRSWTWDFRPLTEIQVAISDVLHEIAELGSADVLPDFPQSEVRTTPAGYQVVVSVPGMKREELQLAVAGQRITVSGERVLPLVPGAEMVRSERPAGPFEKPIDLPADADLSGIRARLADGLLTIDVPFRTEAAPQRVEIDVEAE